MRSKRRAPPPSPALAAGAQAACLTIEQVLALFGPTTFDVYLNHRAYWRNVPAQVWEHVLGGYRVIKKWLSYRERALLGRPLRVDEVREVTSMVRRIAALRLLAPALNTSYESVKAVTLPPAVRS